MKKVVNCVYTHWSNTYPLQVLIGFDETRRIEQAFYWANKNGFDFEVIKYDLKTRSFSLIDADGWNDRYEPIVGDSVCFKADGTITKRKGGFQVYHMKEEFVSPSYPGFDVERARDRTILLNSFPIIKANKSRMGSLKWWKQFLEDYKLPIYMKEV